MRVRKPQRRPARLESMSKPGRSRGAVVPAAAAISAAVITCVAAACGGGNAAAAGHSASPAAAAGESCSSQVSAWTSRGDAALRGTLHYASMATREYQRAGATSDYKKQLSDDTLGDVDVTFLGTLAKLALQEDVPPKCNATLRSAFIAAMGDYRQASSDVTNDDMGDASTELTAAEGQAAAVTADVASSGG